jgi:hypothetical protein
MYLPNIDKVSKIEIHAGDWQIIRKQLKSKTAINQFRFWSQQCPAS